MAPLHPASELHLERVARADHVLRRHGNVGGRRKKILCFFEQLVAERL
jgi:hypothetical protein